MSSNPYFVIASQSDDLINDGNNDNIISMPSNMGNRNEVEQSTRQTIIQGDGIENSEPTNIPVQRQSFSHNIYRFLLGRNHNRRSDCEEQFVATSMEPPIDDNARNNSVSQYNDGINNEQSSNNEEDVFNNEPNGIVSHSADEASLSSASVKSSDKNFLPKACHPSNFSGRTVEVSEHLVRVLVFDIVPWVIGCYIIFFAFRKGGLGLGFTAFLLLVSAHGVLKWWTARGDDDKIDPSDIQQEQDEGPVEENPSETTPNTHRCRRHSTQNTSHHQCHHSHYLDSDDDYTASDGDSQDDDDEEMFSSNNVVVVVNDEPPPSYDSLVNPDMQDLNPGLNVHLKPKDPGSDLLVGDLAGMVNGMNMYRHVLVSNLSPSNAESRRSSILSTSSYLSSEIEDESLPSYSDALKKIKRRKKKSNKSKPFFSDDRQLSAECGLLIGSNSVDNRRALPTTKGNDTIINVPQVLFVDDDHNQSSIEFPHDDIFGNETATRSNTSLDSCPSYHSDDLFAMNNNRISTTDSNSLLFSDAPDHLTK